MTIDGDGSAVAREADHPVAGDVVLAAAFRTSRDAMILFRAGDERIVDVNDVWCLTTGHRREDVVGRSQRELDIWEDLADSARFDAAMREHGEVRDFHFTFRRLLADGSVLQGRASLTAQPILVGPVTYYLVVGRDITAEWQAEQQRQQTRRLEELGRLAGGVAHDFNNMLTVIGAYGEMILGAIEEERPPQRADVEEILATCTRAAGLTRRLLAFSRQQVIEPRAMDLNAVIEAAVGMVAPLLGADIVLRRDLDAALPAVVADAGQLEQVLLNLIINARDAMPDGGIIVVRTRRIVAAEGEVAARIGADAVPGEYASLSVIDTGIGMDDATSARVFEPFFTTKEQGRGTGLGLSVVYGIVRQAGGAIRIQSRPQHGTDVTVSWPAASPALEPLAVEPGHPPSSLDRSIRILLVEDDEAVRIATCRLLRAAGFRVVEARNGHEAIERTRAVATEGEPIDLVLADVVMSRMGGRRLAESLMEEAPHLPVLLMSAYSDRADARSGLANVRVPVVEKPFTAAQLLGAIAEALRLAHAAPRSVPRSP